jgi:hypothetical protein
VKINAATQAIPLKRSTAILRPDPSRVLLRRFDPGDGRRISGIIQRILAVPEEAIGPLLERVYSDFAQRHLHLQRRFLDRFGELQAFLPAQTACSPQRQLLIGSYFVAEYALESAALFSPSMVPHTNQEGPK